MPGAPVSAVAVPVKSMPRPSPKTQTPSAQANDRARAGLTVGRKSRPTPMTTWISAKKVFHTAMSGAMKMPDVGDEGADDEGLALGVGQDDWSSTKPRPNMNGWNCRAASRIQNRPRTICRTRWRRDGQGETAGGPRRVRAAAGAAARARVLVHGPDLRVPGRTGMVRSPRAAVVQAVSGRAGEQASLQRRWSRPRAGGKGRSTWPDVRRRRPPPPASAGCPWRRRRAASSWGRRAARCRCRRNPGAWSASGR